MNNITPSADSITPIFSVIAEATNFSWQSTAEQTISTAVEG